MESNLYMRKLIKVRDQILFSRNGEFTLEELSKRVKPTDILSTESDGWEVTIFKLVEREETDREYERRLLQEQYSEDWKKYEELKLKFNIK
jgi:hypothetical protein